MLPRVYSTNTRASWIFLDLLNCIGRRGWFSAWPSVEDGSALLYASFHMHPDDADRIFLIFQQAICVYGGKTDWAFIRQKHNRFILCPRQVEQKGAELNNLGQAAVVVRKEFPELEREAAADLILLSDFLYRSYGEKANRADT